MTTSKNGTISVKRTDKYDIARVAIVVRRCLMAPVELAQLTAGKTLAVPYEAAQDLIARGYATQVTEPEKPATLQDSAEETV